ncbi:MAG TPA: shikimate dehydrogenase [Candidatus Limnocylindria bacterium]|nr:shikimate dehydrogenase [Candidatus Limnocylindria bacterium]
MAKNDREELTGLLGCPVDENPTGAVMEAAYRALGLPFRYVTMLVRPEGLAAAVAGLRAMHYRGVNLTIPHKVAVLPLLDALSPAAQITGAVNNVTFEDGVARGENTDGKGLLRSLRQHGADPRGKRLTVLGAGGAARAIAVECALAGAESVAVVNRDPGRGEELARLVNERTSAKARYVRWEGTAPVPEGTELLINATSVGLYPDASRPDVDYGGILPGMVACDAVFSPPDTAFLKAAAARGARTIDGLGMLVNQAAHNFTLWTGREAPEEVMEKALRAEFGLA